MRRRIAVIGPLLGLVVLTACGSGASAGAERQTSTSAPAATTGAPTAHELMEPGDAAAFLREPPAGLVVLDVRTPEEFAAGHLAGALNIDIQNNAHFAAQIAKLDPKRPYFVYCRSGHRSAAAVAYLAQHAFRTLYELAGGIGAWQAANLPVVTG